jgi:hypothetical protein
MTAVMVGELRIGTVAKFIGNKPAERWVAWSIIRTNPAEERRQQFPTRKAAIAWLYETYREAKQP